MSGGSDGRSSPLRKVMATPPSSSPVSGSKRRRDRVRELRKARVPQVSGASRLEQSLVELLDQMLRFEQAADRCLSQYFKDNPGWGPRERATLADASFDVLRNLSLYQHWAQTLEPGGELRRMGLLGLRVTDWLPRLTEAEQRWLERMAGEDVSALPLALRCSLPPWLEQHLQGHAGLDVAALAQSLLVPAGMDIRISGSRTDRAALVAQLAEQGIQTAPIVGIETALAIEGHPALERSAAFAQGLFEVQDRGSQLLVQLCSPKRGQTVIDFCAGAGGKTLALADLMRSSGQVYACDTSRARLTRMKPRLARSGLSNVQSFAIDSEADPKLRRLARRADLVLVDAPCSGTGTLRRNPDLKWRGSPEALQRLTLLQGNILAAAAELVKPGGALVYGTCSLLDEENQAIAEAFERAHPEFVREKASQWVPEGACEGDFLRLWPHIHGSDGFFGARWSRRSGV